MWPFTGFSVTLIYTEKLRSDKFSQNISMLLLNFHIKLNKTLCLTENWRGSGSIILIVERSSCKKQVRIEDRDSGGGSFGQIKKLKVSPMN